MGLAFTITIVLAILKLTDLLDISWWWVFSPFILLTILGILIYGIAFIVYLARGD